MGTKPNSVTNPNPTETYTASKTVSGVSLPAGAPLRLTGGQMLANPAAAPWLNQEGHPANAVPEGQSGIPLRKIARWILVLEIEAGESLDLAKVRDYAEKVALPLRLGTPAPVLAGFVEGDTWPSEPGAGARRQTGSSRTGGLEFLRGTQPKRQRHIGSSVAAAHLSAPLRACTCALPRRLLPGNRP